MKRGALALFTVGGLSGGDESQLPLMSC